MDAFAEANKTITKLLEMYEVNVNDPDVEQMIINAAVCIDNAYHGYDENGVKVDLKEQL